MMRPIRKHLSLLLTAVLIAMLVLAGWCMLLAVQA